MPIAKRASDIPDNGSEVSGDGLAGAFTSGACGFALDAEGLLLHGEALCDLGLLTAIPVPAAGVRSLCVTFLALFAGNSSD